MCPFRDLRHRLKAQADMVFREHSKDSPNAILTGKSNIKVGVLLHTNAGGTAGLYIQTLEVMCIVLL